MKTTQKGKQSANYANSRENLISENLRNLRTNIPWLQEVPEGWEVIKLWNCISSINSGCWGNEENKADNNCICVRVVDFDYEKLSIKDKKLTIRCYTYDEIRKKQLKKGDILIEKSGGGEKQSEFYD